MATSHAKEAFDLAQVYLSAVTDGDQLEDVRLEEFEVVDGLWAVTVGFRRAISHLAPGVPMPGLREYRVFRIDPESGDVLSMKMRG